MLSEFYRAETSEVSAMFPCKSAVLSTALLAALTAGRLTGHAEETPEMAPPAVVPVPAADGMMLTDPMVYGVAVAESYRPPGTVGETYTRPSHPIPNDKHPRTAMLAVRDVGGAPLLSTQNMGGFRMKNGIWLFESERPLDPGVCQIVRVEARKTDADIEPFAMKFVRLIPGRIVYLDF